jgi:diaminohydroxyphosphoribosylaminopyrimidine deaminase / 5-amino-6-(5-phosphoribosylamino)uracil reductase
MRRALALAAEGWGMVRPNPLVGAVVVRDGREVGSGWHARYGAAHGEVVALERAGAAARGATLYVTLEPCSHHGLTPPCTEAIARAGVARVVCAAADPNPEAAGGAAWLRERGIEVEIGVESGAARALNAAFFHVHERGTPFVSLKLATSLDGAVAEAAGRPTRITGAGAEVQVHRLRAASDAILVGGATVRADDPLLTVRGVPTIRPPVRVVAASAATLPTGSHLLATLEEAPVLLLCSEEASERNVAELEHRGVRVRRVARGPSGLDPAACLDALWREGLQSVFCEGGPRLGASLLGADRVERLHLLLAPVWFGGAAVPAFPGVRGGGRDRWTLREAQALEGDALLTWDRARS